ncbi:uncharacterized protein ACIBXB_001522 [Morphnus guianensis]
MATDGHGGLIQPRKVPNPVRESQSHRELHRELLFSHSRGILPRHRAELPRVLESRRLRQLREELQGPPSDLEQQLRKRHQRLEEVCAVPLSPILLCQPSIPTFSPDLLPSPHPPPSLHPSTLHPSLHPPIYPCIHPPSIPSSLHACMCQETAGLWGQSRGPRPGPMAVPPGPHLPQHEREAAAGPDPGPRPEFLLVRDSLRKMKLAEPGAWQTTSQCWERHPALSFWESSWSGAAVGTAASASPKR